MTFSATDAAFEGFRIVRRHPLTIVFWALAYLLFFVLFFAIFGSTLAGVMATAKTLEGAGDPSMADLEGLGRSYLLMFGLALPLVLVLGGVLNAAVARAVLRPSEKRFGYMRLGADELRVIVVSVVLHLMMGLLGAVCVAVIGMVAGFGTASGQTWMWLVAVLLGLATFALLIWLSVRLSLAIPITVAERRIALFESFALTRGRALPLLGMAIIVIIMTLLVGLLSSIIALPLTLMSGGGLDGLAAFDGQSTMAILQQAGPMIAIWGVLNALFSALQLAVMYAPFSAAYRDIKGLPVEH